jgi:hypothetical protein
MPIPVTLASPPANSLGSVMARIFIPENIAWNLKAFGLFYVEIAKACYVATGIKK